MEKLTKLAMSSSHAPAVVASLINLESQVVVARQGMSGVSIGEEFLIANSMCREVMRLGLPLIVDDAGTRGDLADTWEQARYGLLSYAAFPVRDEDGQVTALLAAAAPWAHCWSSKELLDLDIASQLFADILSGDDTPRFRDDV
ncbi:GAF domain-containing protein [Actinoplanes couchii]|uniref:GAF domain-containing protein n=1 Tax=Actinoplanes couchii TaxID=403638 RepID=UPI00194121EE|nr:GAF domain-containing protein [Actinoplanes couchii]MDR6324525.1 GAF domain-containing protein [Actinoplanes couchii]